MKHFPFLHLVAVPGLEGPGPPFTPFPFSVNFDAQFRVFGAFGGVLVQHYCPKTFTFPWGQPTLGRSKSQNYYLLLFFWDFGRPGEAMLSKILRKCCNTVLITRTTFLVLVYFIRD